MELVHHLLYRVTDLSHAALGYRDGGGVGTVGSLGLSSVAGDRLGGGHTVGPVVVLGGRGFVSVQEEVGGAGRRCQVVGGRVSGAVP